MKENKIPLVDLKANYLTLKEDIDDAIQNVINQSAFIGGEGNVFVTQFEEDFKNYLGANHVVSCANGTDAIEIGLQSLNIGVGDEVLVPALTWISTAEAVVNIGAKPVFIDVNEQDCLMNTKLIEEKITNNTKAIIAVHLYGAPADVEKIEQICKKHNLFFIEDCAQAHGAEFNNVKVGTFGDVATFSFYPGKNLGAFGDAGAIVMKSKEVAGLARQIANHGQKGKHNHLRIGRNSRMDGIQAAILSVKLKFIDESNNLRIKHAKYYNQLIVDDFEKPYYDDHLKSVYHLYVIKTKKRDKLIDVLKENKISTGIHYPKSLSQISVFGNNFSCPVAESICGTIMSLPIYPELEKDKIEFISQLLNKNIT